MTGDLSHLQQAIVLAIGAGAFATLSIISVLVVRDEHRRESTATDEMWARSIETFRARALESAAERELARFHRIRPPRFVTDRHPYVLIGQIDEHGRVTGNRNQIC